MATEGNNVAAAIFSMKARAGWREKHEVQISVAPAHELTDAQLLEIIQQGRDDQAIEVEDGEP